MKPQVCLVIWILLVCASARGSVSAHAPSDMTLSYEPDSETLVVTLVHTVGDPLTHYVYRIEVKKNGVIYTTEEFENQPTDAQVHYSFSVSAARGDTLEVTAACNRGGSLTAELVVGDTQKDVTVPQLWPVHAVFMSVGLALMVVSVFNVVNKAPRSWWFKAHKTIGGLAVVCVVIGLATAVYMVSASSGGHFKVPHAYLGIVTMFFSVVTPFVGFISVKSRGRRPQMRKLHLWCGRVAVVLIVVTLGSGLLQAGII